MKNFTDFLMIYLRVLFVEKKFNWSFDKSAFDSLESQIRPPGQKFPTPGLRFSVSIFDYKQLIENKLVACHKN